MPVFRINKNTNYTVMSNYHLKDKNLSLKAKGLLSLMLSLPENWDYSINGLVSICKENIKAIRSGLVELETYDYLSRNRIQRDGGKFDYEYLIYEQPYSRFGHTVNGHTVNGTQLNKDNKDTKNKRKYKKKSFQDYEQRPYTEEEIKEMENKLSSY